MKETSLFDSLLEEPQKPSGPVTCLGMTFENDDARRAHFTEKLRKKLQDLEFRKIEGFPIGTDEAILNLSDPPYYTACPNPWIADFIRLWEAEKAGRGDTETRGRGEDTASPNPRVSESYHREPFAADVSEGKNDPIYNAHSYHTKVPHKAIMRYILHYTDPGDIVFDGFCGTGMTGVAAQMCGDREVVMSLGYQVKLDGTTLQEETDEDGKKVWRPFSKLGARRAVLNDLSPAATFIAYNYNTPVDVAAFEKEAKRILKEVEEECGWMYETLHVEPASSRLISALEFSPCDPFKTTEVKYRKDNLPHIQVPGATYFITFRTEEFRILSPHARDIALKAICHWDNQRWKLFSAVVMPDHVHIIARPLAKSEEQHWDLSEILHSIKSFSANEINKLEGKKGTPVWQTESYDRIIRDSNELANELAYLNHNPVKAGLVEKAEEYAWQYVAYELKKAGWKPAPLGKINYTVWSEFIRCSNCGYESTYWELAVDQKTRYRKKKDEPIKCPKCYSESALSNWERVKTTIYDAILGDTLSQVKQQPVLINYSCAGKKFEKTPDNEDLAISTRIEKQKIASSFPSLRMPLGDEARRNDDIGLTHTHHFYNPRTLSTLSLAWQKAGLSSQSRPLRFWIETGILGFTKINRYLEASFSQVNRYLKGTLYVAPFITEVTLDYALKGKIKKLCNLFSLKRSSLNVIHTRSTASTNQMTNCIDYIFTDPPFGGNIMYSELNFIWDSWLGTIEDVNQEAIVSKKQQKGMPEYQQLMSQCFHNYFMALKPGRWMTVEFHNSKNSVWVSIQEALQHAGFVVADVRTLDKKQMTMQQMTSSNAVKQDLVISAYKPNGGLEQRFQHEAGSENGVWDFVRTHLKQLPVFAYKNGKAETIVERQNYLLYDRMVAFHVQRSVPVPISSSWFYLGLTQRFSERDSMYFLPDQVAEYDRKRMTCKELIQASLFVSDEASAIQWLGQIVKEKPQTFQEIHPQFMKEIGGWSKTETPLELRELLNQNFLCYDGKGPVPEQIHAYLSTNWKELRNLPKDDPILATKARDRWYVPDPNKAGDLEKLREKALLKEFEEYRQVKKKLKVFRLEAVRAGFKKAWQDRDYAVIVAVADQIPNKVLEEDPKLLMWYDQAVTRMES